MRKIKLFEEKAQMELAYYLLVEEVENHHFFCENYGVAVEGKDGSYEEIRGISPRKERIEELLALLFRNQVSPIALGDVVADWL